MNLHKTSDIEEVLREKYVFLDNDFLSQIAADIDFFTEIQKLLHKSYQQIDPLTEFEFLNGNNLEHRRTKSRFLSQGNFLPVIRHQEVYFKLEQNALLLAEIYITQLPNVRCSYVDLMLAARLMYYYGKTLLITGNKKDFPSYVFDVVGVLNYEKPGDGAMKAYSMITFNANKFNVCHAALEKRKELILKKEKDYEERKLLVEFENIPF